MASCRKNRQARLASSIAIILSTIASNSGYTTSTTATTTTPTSPTSTSFGLNHLNQHDYTAGMHLIPAATSKRIASLLLKTVKNQHSGNHSCDSSAKGELPWNEVVGSTRQSRQQRQLNPSQHRHQLNRNHQHRFPRRSQIPKSIPGLLAVKVPPEIHEPAETQSSGKSLEQQMEKLALTEPEAQIGKKVSKHRNPLQIETGASPTLEFSLADQGLQSEVQQMLARSLEQVQSERRSNLRNGKKSAILIRERWNKAWVKSNEADMATESAELSRWKHGVTAIRDLIETVWSKQFVPLVLASIMREHVAADSHESLRSILLRRLARVKFSPVSASGVAYSKLEWGTFVHMVEGYGAGACGWYLGGLTCSKIPDCGIWHFFRGDVYEGEFRDGHPDGWGKLTWAGGKGWYEGGWKNGRKHGFGVRHFADGNEYKGEFRADKYNGEGTLTWEEGKEWYRGGFHDGLAHGFGKEHFENGDEYVGNFAAGKYEGEGLLTRAGGERWHEGAWKGGKQNGFGTRRRHLKKFGGFQLVGNFADSVFMEGVIEWSDRKIPGWKFDFRHISRTECRNEVVDNFVAETGDESLDFTVSHEKKSRKWSCRRISRRKNGNEVVDNFVSESEGDLMEFVLGLRVEKFLWDRFNMESDCDTKTVRSEQIEPEKMLSEIGDASDFNVGDFLHELGLEIGQIRPKNTSVRSPSRLSESGSARKIREEQLLGQIDLTNMTPEESKQNNEEREEDSDENQGDSQLHAPSSKQTFAALVAENLERNDPVAQEKLRSTLLNMKPDVKLVQKLYTAVLETHPKAVNYFKPVTRTHKSSHKSEKSHSANSGIPSSNLPPSSNMPTSANISDPESRVTWNLEGGDDDVAMWMRYELLVQKVYASLDKYPEVKEKVLKLGDPESVYRFYAQPPNLEDVQATVAWHLEFIAAGLRTNYGKTLADLLNGNMG